MPPRCRDILTVSLAGLLVGLGAAAGARAQTEAEGPTTPAEAQPGRPRAVPPAPADAGPPPEGDQLVETRDVSLEIELLPWYPSPGGVIVLPGETRGGRDIDVEDLNIDSPRLSPAGRVRFEVDEWSFTLSAAQFNIDQQAISPVTRPIGDIDLMRGDAVRTQMEFTTAELIVGNTFFRRDLYAFDYPQSRLGVELEAGLGARVDHFDITLQRLAGGEASADEMFLLPLAALEARLRPTPRTTLSFAATAGWNPGLADQTGVTSDLIVRAGWDITPHVELVAGYRITIQRLEAGEGAETFEVNGSQAGLFAGVSIGF